MGQVHQLGVVVNRDEAGRNAADDEGCQIERVSGWLLGGDGLSGYAATQRLCTASPGGCRSLAC